MITTYIHGPLGEDLGKSQWTLAVESPTEAFQAINVNTGGKLERLLRQNNYLFTVKAGDKELQNFESCNAKFRCKEFHFTPVMAGSGKGGLGFIIAGLALLIIAPYLVGPAGVKATTSAIVAAEGAVPTSAFGLGYASIFAGNGGFLAGTSVMLGMSLTLGGLFQLMAPGPPDPGEQPGDPSYLLGSVDNVTREGVAVPILLGIHSIVGSVVVSGGIRVVNISENENTA